MERIRNRRAVPQAVIPGITAGQRGRWQVVMMDRNDVVAVAFGLAAGSMIDSKEESGKFRNSA
ncbi:hypothetical protein DSM101010T_18450 [Desulfovibrio subterraneus]|uniref:Uncharacterized protein n=1 Tax=Desulfovibrio subterraneus TaxID=2718620 RepID=A0A7J0BIJ8_9BACT|nr:hypothetical protein DSM101010T_18450 [Desulfovibrio subterraneus]